MQIFVVVVEMLVLKTIHFYPRKRKGGFGFWSKPPKQIVFMFWLWFNFKNNRHTHAVLKTHFKKVYNHKKLSKLRFWQLTTLLCVFKNTAPKNVCASIVFKAKLEPKHKEKIVLGIFLQKPQRCFFEGFNSFKNLNFK